MNLILSEKIYPSLVDSEWREGFHSIVASYPAAMSLYCEPALDPWLDRQSPSNDSIHGQQYIRQSRSVQGMEGRVGIF